MSADVSPGAMMVIGGIVLSIGVLVYSGGDAAQADFNYDTASHEERHAFLEAEAKPIETSIRSQMGSSLQLKDREIDANGRKITFRININGFLARSFSLPTVKTQVYQKLCPGFVQSKLGRNGVTVVQKFVSSGQGTLVSLPLSTTECNRYVS